MKKILNRTPPEISKIEQALPHYTIRLLAQLRTNESPILHAYLHKITHNTELPPMPLSNTWHQTPIWLHKSANWPGPWAAMGRSWGGGGAAGPLVGPAGVGSGAGMRGVAMSEPPGVDSNREDTMSTSIWNGSNELTRMCFFQPKYLPVRRQYIH